MDGESGQAMKDIYYACVGTLYFVVGITSVVLNSRLIKVFHRYKPMKSRGVLHINLALTNIALVSGFVLTGTSNLKQRWPFSDLVCKAYSLLGMVSGTAEILTAFSIGLDVYLAVCWPKLSKSLTTWHYCTLVLPAIWMVSLFWSLLPFYGWGSYSIDPAGTTCLISWQTVDEYYTFFILNYASWCYIIPLAVFYYLQSLSSQFDKSDNKQTEVDVWFTETHMVKMGNWFCFLTALQWSLFGYVCLAVFFIEPSTIPKWLCAMVPLLAKIISISYPVSYSLISARFRDAFFGIADEQDTAKDPPETRKKSK